MSSRKVKSHCKNGLCKIQSSKIYKQGITIVLRLVKNSAIQAGVNKQNTNLKVSKNVLSFNDLLLNFCHMHLYWHHENDRVLKNKKQHLLTIYSRHVVKGKVGWEYYIVAPIIFIKSELPSRVLRTPDVILNFIS